MKPAKFNPEGKLSEWIHDARLRNNHVQGEGAGVFIEQPSVPGPEVGVRGVDANSWQAGPRDVGGELVASAASSSASESPDYLLKRQISHWGKRQLPDNL